MDQRVVFDGPRENLGAFSSGFHAAPPLAGSWGIESNGCIHDSLANYRAETKMQLRRSEKVVTVPLVVLIWETDYEIVWKRNERSSGGRAAPQVVKRSKWLMESCRRGRGI